MSEPDRKVSDFQRLILSFYDQRGRSLPWRETTDIYRITVSELMLQQTQVARVKEKYREFLASFPTPQALASASQRDVVARWQGLGYNRRALYVHNAAQLLLNNSDPSYEELLEVKGIGPYTAAAIRVFARNEERAAIDVNIRRVHERFFGEVSDAFIESCVPVGRSRDWHNALMDFGSLLCTKRAPSCEECPLASECFALRNDTFSAEVTSSQPRFEGSVRWHRGRVLKRCLEEPRTQEQLFELLDERYRDRKKLVVAIKQLREEGFILPSNPLRIAH